MGKYCGPFLAILFLSAVVGGMVWFARMMKCARVVIRTSELLTLCASLISQDETPGQVKKRRGRR